MSNSTSAARPWRLPMRARPIDEPHRSATPLELLFDLTFVVAVAQVAAELAHGIADNHPWQALGWYLMAFFAIWWAWMNFTWFASAYDCDDVPYRLLTLVQMAGVLVLAAGVPAIFQDGDFRAALAGYVVMRVAMLAQWTRAARSDPEHRETARRFVIGVGLVQVAWLARPLLPDGAAFAVFFVLAAVELAVPIWAEHPAMTSWHPHHIAERYGLFTIIVLGECVLAATIAVQTAITDDGVSAPLLVVAAGGLALLFALWWMYFLKDAGHGLERHRHLGFVWGFGHFAVFASLAALGAGLEVAAEAVSHPVDAPDTVVAAAIAVPVVVFLVTVWALHAPLGTTPRGAVVWVGAAAAACVAVVVAVSAGMPLAAAVPLLVLPPAALVTQHHVRGSGGASRLSEEVQEPGVPAAPAP